MYPFVQTSTGCYAGFVIRTVLLVICGRMVSSFMYGEFCAYATTYNEVIFAHLFCFLMDMLLILCECQFPLFQCQKSCILSIFFEFLCHVCHYIRCTLFTWSFGIIELIMLQRKKMWVTHWKDLGHVVDVIVTWSFGVGDTFIRRADFSWCDCLKSVLGGEKF